MGRNGPPPKGTQSVTPPPPPPQKMRTQEETHQEKPESTRNSLLNWMFLGFLVDEFSDGQ